MSTKIPVKLSSKGEATAVFHLLFQRLVVLTNGCNITFDNGRRHEYIHRQVNPPALFQ